MKLRNTKMDTARTPTGIELAHQVRWQGLTDSLVNQLNMKHLMSMMLSKLQVFLPSIKDIHVTFIDKRSTIFFVFIFLL